MTYLGIRGSLSFSPQQTKNPCNVIETIQTERKKKKNKKQKTKKKHLALNENSQTVEML